MVLVKLMAEHRKNKIDSYLTTCTKLNSKWIKDINIKLDKINFIDEKVGNRVECISTGDSFLNRKLTAQIDN